MFSTVEAISDSDILEMVDFTTREEEVISEKTSTHIQKKVIIREDTNTPLGLVPMERVNIHYKEILKFVSDALIEANISYKIIDSTVDQKGNLFQQYLLDMEIEAPDEHRINPLLILKASYINKPFEVMFGTYRFVCSNGAIVGNTIDQIECRWDEVKDLLGRSLVDEIRSRILDLEKVTKAYGKLSNSSIDEFLEDFVAKKTISSTIRINVLDKLEEENIISIPLKAQDIMLSKDIINTASPDLIFAIENNVDGWYFYNVATAAATHLTKTAKARDKANRAVSKVFGV